MRVKPRRSSFFDNIVQERDHFIWASPAIDLSYIKQLMTSWVAQYMPISLVVDFWCSLEKMLL